MRKKRDKKGVIGHIEMVLSFVIFIGFLIFLFYLFNPFKKSGINDSMLNTVEEGIINFSKVKVVESTVILNDSLGLPAGCFDIPRFQSGAVRASGPNGELRWANNSASLGPITRIQSIGKFNKLYFANFFVEEPPAVAPVCASLSSGQYSLSLIKERQYAYSMRLADLQSNYTSNYAALKANISSGADFGFIARYPNGTVLYKAVNRKATKTHVLARDVRVETIDRRGVVEQIIINIQVW